MTRTTKRFRAGASLSHSGKEANPMTEELHKFTITIDDVVVNLRSNGDGFEYARIKDALRAVVKNCMELASTTLVPEYGIVSINDEVIA